jgi:hypothetical protein
VISELIHLSCFEPTEPNITLDPPDLMGLFTHEEFELENYSANMDSITALASQFTYTLIGWTTAQHEAELASMLSGFTCAFGFENPAPEDEGNVPTIVKFPKMLGKMRSSGQRVFSPLAKSGQF